MLIAALPFIWPTRACLPFLSHVVPVLAPKCLMTELSVHGHER
jgi:hypothetical protein